MGGRLLLLRRPFWQAFYFPMQTIILIDNQLVMASVVQIWFKKRRLFGNKPD